MAIIKFEPFDEIEKFFKGFDDMMPARLTSFMPPVDMYQTADDVVVETPVPGIDPNKVEVSIENDVLTIHGESEKKREVEEQNYYRKEIRTGNFYRQIPLPTHVQGDKATAVSDNGILKIRIPKAPLRSAKTIKVEIKK